MNHNPTKHINNNSAIRLEDQLPVNITAQYSTSIIDPYKNTPDSIVHSTSIKRSPRFKSADVNLKQFRTGNSPSMVGSTQLTMQDIQNDAKLTFKPFPSQFNNTKKITTSSNQNQSSCHTQPSVMRIQEYSPNQVPLNKTAFSTTSPLLSPRTSNHAHLEQSNAYIQAMKALQNKIKHLEATLEDQTEFYEQEKAKQIEEIKELDTMLQELKEENENIKTQQELSSEENFNQLKDCKEKEVKLQEQILELELEKQETEQKFKTSHENYNNSQQKYVHLEQLQNDLLVKNKQISNELDEANKMINFLNGDNDKLKQRLEETTLQTFELKDSIQNLEKQIVNLEEDVKLLQDENEQTRLKYENEQNELLDIQNTNKENYNQKMKEILEEKTQLFAELTEIKDQLALLYEAEQSLKEQNVQYEAENQLLKEKWEQIQQDNYHIRKQSSAQKDINNQLLHTIQKKENEFKTLDILNSQERQKNKASKQQIKDLERLYSQEKIKNENQLEILQIQQRSQKDAIKLQDNQKMLENMILQENNHNIPQRDIIHTNTLQHQYSSQPNIKQKPYHQTNNTIHNLSNINQKYSPESVRFVDDSMVENIPRFGGGGSKKQYSQTVNNLKTHSQSIHSNKEQAQRHNMSVNQQQYQQPSGYDTTKKRYSQPQFMNQSYNTPSLSQKVNSNDINESLPDENHQNTIKTRGRQKSQKQLQPQQYINPQNIVQDESHLQDQRYAKHLRDLDRIDKEVRQEQYKQMTYTKSKQYKLDLELVNRQIQDIEIELVSHNLEYKKLSEEIMRPEGDPYYLDSVRKQMVEISQQIQKKNQHLFNLKKKEDELVCSIRKKN